MATLDATSEGSTVTQVVTFSDEEERIALEAQARIHAGVVHPNISAYHRSWVKDGTFSLVREGCGKPLWAFLPENPEARMRETWAMQVASAVDHLHGTHKIVHRDISPHNIGVSEDRSTAKVMDVRLAAPIATIYPADSYSKVALEDVACSHFSAPELRWNTEYSLAVDIFSLSMTFIALFSKTLEEEKLKGELNDTKENGLLRTPVIAECQNGVRMLLLQCLTPKPDRRPNSENFLQRLREIWLEGDHDHVRSGKESAAMLNHLQSLEEIVPDRANTSGIEHTCVRKAKATSDDVPDSKASSSCCITM